MTRDEIFQRLRRLEDEVEAMTDPAEVLRVARDVEVLFDVVECHAMDLLLQAAKDGQLQLPGGAR